MTQIHEDKINLEDLSCEAYNYRIGDDLVIHWSANDKDVMVPSYTMSSKRVEVPGVVINITVADNGFIIKTGKTTKIADGQYQLNDLLKELYTKEVVTKKKFDIEQWDDIDFETIGLKFNVHYKAQQVRAKK